MEASSLLAIKGMKWMKMLDSLVYKGLVGAFEATSHFKGVFKSVVSNYPVVSLCLIASALFLFFILTKVRVKKRWRVKASKNALRVLRRCRTDAECFSYMRKMDPFVFEELILTAYKQNGHKIKRNKRYTGDGGIDGRAKINGKWHLIQAKRYKSAINPQHVKDFETICRKRGKPGVFIHTGRTGPNSRKLLHESKHLNVVSGANLLDLFGAKKHQCDRQARTWS